MNLLTKSELSIIGDWELVNGKLIANADCVRIEWLIRNHLVVVSKDDWECVLRDPQDNRYWLLHYPQSHMHGGGPPSLKVIDSSEV